MHYSWEDEEFPSLTLIICFADHWEKGKASRFLFYFLQAAFIFVILFICAIQLLFSSFLVLCLFVFLISHHHFIWAVKIQRSDRQLTWDSWASSHCSLHACHHYNTFHPARGSVPALPLPPAPPPNSPRNVPAFLLLAFYLICVLLASSSFNSHRICLHGCCVLFL